MAKIIEVIIYTVDGGEWVAEESDEIWLHQNDGLEKMKLDLDSLVFTINNKNFGFLKIKTESKKVTKATSDWQDDVEDPWTRAYKIIFLSHICSLLEITDELLPPEKS